MRFSEDSVWGSKDVRVPDASDICLAPVKACMWRDGE